MDIGTRSELLSLLSFCMIYMANDGVLEKHTYNLVGNDVKQDAILTWSCLSWLLLNKVICNFNLVSYLSFWKCPFESGDVDLVLWSDNGQHFKYNLFLTLMEGFLNNNPLFQSLPKFPWKGWRQMWFESLLWITFSKRENISTE